MLFCTDPSLKTGIRISRQAPMARFYDVYAMDTREGLAIAK